MTTPDRGPVQVVNTVLKALQEGDCEALFSAMPLDAFHSREDFIGNCVHTLFRDLRAGMKKLDLSSYRFATTSEPVRDGRTRVIVRPTGLSSRWNAVFDLELQKGEWRVSGLFGPGKEGLRMEVPYGAPEPGKGADELDDHMVALPEGRLVVGCREGEEENRCLPPGPVDVKPFQIDTHEVTVSDYDKCVRAGACERGMYVTAADRNGCNFGRAGRARHPMNCVSYWGAAQFCEWAGKRLPTEIEWEAAARGAAGRSHPWGNEPLDCTRAKVKGCGSTGTGETGSRPAGATPEGVFDLSGNVEEWTLAFDRMKSTIRGGAFDIPPERVRPYYRMELGLPYRLDVLGFRCAR